MWGSKAFTRVTLSADRVVTSDLLHKGRSPPTSCVLAHISRLELPAFIEELTSIRFTK